MTDDDALDRLAADAGDAIPVPMMDDGALGAVMARARRRRHRRRTLVAIAAVIPLAAGVVWATTGRGHSQQVASVGPTTTLSELQQLCQERTTRSSQPPTPIVYVNANATDAQVAQIRAELSASPYVTSLTYLDHAGSYAQAKKLFSDNPALLQTLTPDQLPTSFKVRLVGFLSPSVAGRLMSSIEAMPGVYTVRGLVDDDPRCPHGDDTSATTTTTPPVPTTTGPTNHDRSPDVTVYFDPSTVHQTDLPLLEDTSGAVIFTQALDQQSVFDTLKSAAPTLAATVGASAVPSAEQYWFRSPQDVQHAVESFTQDQSLYDVYWSDPALSPDPKETDFMSHFQLSDAYRACNSPGAATATFGTLVYAKAGLSDADLSTLRTDILHVPGVKSADYQAPDGVRGAFQQAFADQPTKLALIPGAGFATPFVVTLKSGTRLTSPDAALGALTNVTLVAPPSMEPEGIVSLCLGGIDGFIGE